MKLLRVRASNYKGCIDDFTIDLTAKSKKTSEDKEYELQEIAEGLYRFNTVAIVGKNASGKTSAIELLEIAYDILSLFRLKRKFFNFDNTLLDITFYFEGYIYNYKTTLRKSSLFENRSIFEDQRIYKKKYFKSNIKNIYEKDGFEEIKLDGELPEDISSVFFILKKADVRNIFFDCHMREAESYSLLFRSIKTFDISNDIFMSILRIFDENINTIKMIDETHFEINYLGNTETLSNEELVYMLSSGTTKGMYVYISAIAALKYGFDLLIDEIENHFHKTLVENLISLFKDKSVNRKNSSIIFTTHYCELLDLTNRSDNIFITTSEKKITINNMYERYSIRTDLLKSKKFYENTFNTAVNYDELMNLKGLLLQ
ncbi:ATP-binding protein [Ruminiclostridium herbifermentans]|uniref:ATP-binding protein n=1 Tax=Ruminiclostridium herbifermentans TaxID=2488810 RepID=A0A4U7JDL8_9FIRM|nr:ATP-binding protein [Ruminiclostridium herbifermentans]QNU67703.1 ATP-binding protein [Ruminiclostridium herbifermentans]